eukprot:jgi/Ulvmu1/6950/UM033_0007.1
MPSKTTFAALPVGTSSTTSVSRIQLSSSNIALPAGSPSRVRKPSRKFFFDAHRCLKMSVRCAPKRTTQQSASLLLIGRCWRSCSGQAVKRDGVAGAETFRHCINHASVPSEARFV